MIWREIAICDAEVDFGYSESVIADVGCQLGFGLRLPHLRKHLISVQIGRDVEVDDKTHCTIIGVGGIHVVHVVHSAHLLLDLGCYRLLYGECIGSHIGRVDLNLRPAN